MAITSGILLKSELIIERYMTTLEQMSQNTHYYYVLKIVCRVSIKRKSLKANHAETKAASEALRSGLVWVINNEAHISNRQGPSSALDPLQGRCRRAARHGYAEDAQAIRYEINPP